MCGLTAVLSTKLAAEGISCNIVAGTYHDHLFVDAARAQEAIGFIYDIQNNSSEYEKLAKQSMESYKKK